MGVDLLGWMLTFGVTDVRTQPVVPCTWQDTVKAVQISSGQCENVYGYGMLCRMAATGVALCLA